MAFKVLQVDHIGIGVNDLAATKEFYKNALGIQHLPEDEVVEEQKVKVSFFPCGDAELEFLETTTPDGPIGKFIEKNGGRDGIQHVALRVDNIENAIADLMAKGVRILTKNLVTVQAVPPLLSYIQKQQAAYCLNYVNV